MKVEGTVWGAHCPSLAIALHAILLASAYFQCLCEVYSRHCLKGFIYVISFMWVNLLEVSPVMGPHYKMGGMGGE